METYKAKIHCINCDYDHRYFEVDVPKGISVSEFLKNWNLPTNEMMFIPHTIMYME